MNILRCRCILFSATGTTEKIVKEIAKGIGLNTTVTNFTKSDTRNSDIDRFEENELAIIGIPVHSGTIPEITETFLKKLNGNNTPTVIVAVYGNRHYDNALFDLSSILKTRGFKVLAAGAFVGEHSFSTVKTPIAVGRPDKNDLEASFQFGKEMRHKLDAISSSTDIDIPQIPYDKDLKMSPTPAITPATNMKKCDMCGLCIDLCPTDAIHIAGNKVISDKNKCIICYACIKECPQQARAVNNLFFFLYVKMMSRKLTERKEPEIFLAI